VAHPPAAPVGGREQYSAGPVVVPVGPVPVAEPVVVGSAVASGTAADFPAAVLRLFAIPLPRGRRDDFPRRRRGLDSRVESRPADRRWFDPRVDPRAAGQTAVVDFLEPAGRLIARLLPVRTGLVRIHLARPAEPSAEAAPDEMPDARSAAAVSAGSGSPASDSRVVRDFAGESSASD
jgi:hypothetical protein